MIRLPRGLLDLGVAERYCTSDAASVWAAGDHVILSLSSEDEDEYWEEAEGRLASIALVRSELAAGDLRLVYLSWLLSVQAEEVGDKEVEPPLPPGLRTPSAPLRAVADFLRLDEDLLTAATTAGAEVQTVAESAGEPGRWIEDLPGPEKDALLLQAARGKGSQVKAVLQRRFRAERSPGARLPIPEHGQPGSCGTRRPPGVRDGNGPRRSGGLRNWPARHARHRCPGAAPGCPGAPGGASLAARGLAYRHQETARIRRGSRHPAGPAGTCRTRRQQQRVQPAIPATS